MSTVVEKNGPIKRKFGGGKAGRKVPGRQLIDYRWVYRNPSGAGGTEIQKTLQELLKKDPGKFMDRLQKLEDAFAALKGVAGAAVEATKVDDDGGLELVEEWLNERQLRRTQAGGGNDAEAPGGAGDSPGDSASA